MKKPSHIRLAYILVFFILSCEKIPLVEAETFDNRPWEQVQSQLEDEGLHSEQLYRPSSMNEETYQGAINAVKKAYQLVNITFTPLRPIAYNIGTYQPDNTYRGMIYSSVKEIGTYVGNNISFHTFMTAIHNPKSRIYTERIDESPYHGTNCRAYYGVVCSSLVSYALGLTPILATYDFVASEDMEELDYSDIDGFHIADVLWKSGHVAIITDVVRDQNDNTVSIEISEAIHGGCRRFSVSRTTFYHSASTNYTRALRYKHLETNINYVSASEFVTVFDESPVPFEYNEDICADKGDKSCYFVGEDVVLNLSSSDGTVEIYRDTTLQFVVDVTSEDLRLTDLDFGLYRARVVKGDSFSCFTSWMMVDKTIIPSVDEMRLYFNSKNAIPTTIFVCGKNGGRNSSFTEIICRRFSEEEIENGFIEISQDRLRREQPYFEVNFLTEFGTISTTPIEWK